MDRRAKFDGALFQDRRPPTPASSVEKSRSSPAFFQASTKTFAPLILVDFGSLFYARVHMDKETGAESMVMDFNPDTKAYLNDLLFRLPVYPDIPYDGKPIIVFLLHPERFIPETDSRGKGYEVKDASGRKYPVSIDEAVANFMRAIPGFCIRHQDCFFIPPGVLYPVINFDEVAEHYDLRSANQILMIDDGSYDLVCSDRVKCLGCDESVSALGAYFSRLKVKPYSDRNRFASMGSERSSGSSVLLRKVLRGRLMTPTSPPSPPPSPERPYSPGKSTVAKSGRL